LMKPRLGCAIVVSMEMTMSASRETCNTAVSIGSFAFRLRAVQ
jgi:hypothetical protein